MAALTGTFIHSYSLDELSLYTSHRIIVILPHQFTVFREWLLFHHSLEFPCKVPSRYSWLLNHIPIPPIPVSLLITYLSVLLSLISLFFLSCD
jgi:hypothetical protein